MKILCVDDDRDFVELTETFLSRELPHATIVTCTDPDQAFERIEAEHPDCVVSDFEMPGTSGLELLESVRATQPDLPFVLFTGKGSEEVASEAISAGVSDYLQKGTGVDQYTVLANRVKNLVEKYRAETELERSYRRFTTLIENSTDVISILDEAGRFQYISPAGERIFGRTAIDRQDESAFEHVHPDDLDAVRSAFDAAINDTTYEPHVEYRYRAIDGTWRWVESTGRNLLDDPYIEGFVVNTRDITGRKERAAELHSTNVLIETLIEHLPLGVVAEDDSREILFANSVFCTIFGVAMPPQAIIGESGVETVQRAKPMFDDPEKFIEGIEAAIDRREPSSPEALGLVDGRVMERRYIPVRIAPDRKAHLWTYRDVTDDALGGRADAV